MFSYTEIDEINATRTEIVLPCQHVEKVTSKFGFRSVKPCHHLVKVDLTKFELFDEQDHNGPSLVANDDWEFDPSVVGPEAKVECCDHCGLVVCSTHLDHERLCYDCTSNK